jgi:Flp pilus assembly CpaF family ATPase
LLEEVLNEVLGFGPMQYLLNDPTISEIMVNSPTDIFIERKGKICRSRRKFVDEAHVMNIVDRIVRPLGKTANARTPMVDGRLPDGSRVNIVIPPLALNGPSMSIRKFFKKKLDSEALVTFGSMTEGMRLFLEAAVKARMNIIIAGGTGSGKTTTLNITSNFISARRTRCYDRRRGGIAGFIPNIVRLESRPKNIEGEGEVSIRDLVKNALRMRPDRVIVGECRGGEALDMLQAMNTGHEGTLIHGSLEHAARYDFSFGNFVLDERIGFADSRGFQADFECCEPDRSTGAHERWLAQNHSHHRSAGHGRRHLAASGYFSLRAKRPQCRRKSRRTPSFNGLPTQVRSRNRVSRLSIAAQPVPTRLSGYKRNYSWKC